MAHSIEHPLPDKNFFESNRRSALLRNICIRAIEASEYTIASEGTNQEAFKQLLDTNTQLTELGIVPGMHTIAAGDPEQEEKREEILTNPIIAAEWLSGQIRNLIINTSALNEASKNRNAQLEEHDELLGAGQGMFLAESPKVASKSQPLAMVGLLSVMLDAEAGPSQLE